eukprot:scaffold290336_cov19-Tisochrysis_lutea.AAC.1
MQVAGKNKSAPGTHYQSNTRIQTWRTAALHKAQDMFTISIVAKRQHELSSMMLLCSPTVNKQWDQSLTVSWQATLQLPLLQEGVKVSCGRIQADTIKKSGTTYVQGMTSLSLPHEHPRGPLPGAGTYSGLAGIEALFMTCCCAPHKGPRDWNSSLLMKVAMTWNDRGIVSWLMATDCTQVGLLEARAPPAREARVTYFLSLALPKCDWGGEACQDDQFSA